MDIIHYEVYHIIEMTDDQQTCEVIAQSTDDAIGKYLFHFACDEWDSITQTGSNIVVDFPTEVCIIWQKTPNVLYAKWVSKLGLLIQPQPKGRKTMKIKREIRYIRYRICRSIYYADQCPMDNRKNYNNIGKNILCACGLGVGVLGFMVLAVVLA